MQEVTTGGKWQKWNRKRGVKAKATERRRDKGLGSIPMRLVEVINTSEILARVAPTVGILGYP